MLTEQEISVLELKQKGLKQTEIARKMKISQPAVSNFYNNALNKIRQAEQVIRIKKEMGIK